MVSRASVLDVGVRHRPDVAHDLHARRARWHDEHRRVVVRPAVGIGLGEHQHDVGNRGVGDEPLAAVDHPLVAILHGSGADHGRVGSGEERLGEREGAGDLTPEVGPEPPILLRVRRAVGQELHVPAVGCLHAEDRHRHHAATDDLRHQCELELAEPASTDRWVEKGSPQALRLHLVLQVALDELPLLGRQPVEYWLERDQLSVDERPHPRELLLELRLRLEVPRHPLPVRSCRRRRITP